MATYVYGNAVKPSGYNFNFYSFFTYDISISATSYVLTITAGIKSSSNDVGWEDMSVTVYGTNKNAKSRTGVFYSTNKSDSQYRQVVIGSFTWTWDRTTTATTKHVKCTITGPGVGYSTTGDIPFTVPALDSYGISYDGNGATSGPSPNYVVKYYGQNLTISSSVSRTNYEFCGWGTSASATTATYGNGSVYSANAGATLYAIWRRPVTISYNANGGTGAPSAQTAYIYNSASSVSIGLYSTKPTRTGYTFDGWKTSGGTAYNPGGVYSFSSSTTLIAQWSPITYTLSYNLDGGTVSPSNPSSYLITDTPITLNNPKKDYYEFMGWTGTGLTTTTKVVTIPSNGTGDRTYTAQWRDTYVAPTININVARRDNSEHRGIINPDDFDDAGTVPFIDFQWQQGTIQKKEGDSSSIEPVVPTQFQVIFTDQDTGTQTVLTKTLSASPVRQYYDEMVLATEKSYKVEVVLIVPNAGGQSRSTVSAIDIYSQAYFIMDINPDGTAIGFGMAVYDDTPGFFCGMSANFKDFSGIVRGMFDLFYPKGSYYETHLTNVPPSGRTTPTDTDLKALGNTWFNPNYAWGGIWTLELAGQVHVSAGTGYAVSGALTNVSDGGESTHVLTPAETAMKDHSHTINHGHGFTQPTVNGGSHTHTYDAYTNRAIYAYHSDGNARFQSYTASTGYDGGHTHSVSGGAVTDHAGSSGGQTAANGNAHNNMQPYINVYRWHRTA